MARCTEDQGRPGTAPVAIGGIGGIGDVGHVGHVLGIGGIRGVDGIGDIGSIGSIGSVDGIGTHGSVGGTPKRWLRRARPLLGTLVEVGIDAATPAPDAAFEAAFATIAEVQRALSRFDAASDIARFNALPAGASLTVRPMTAVVLEAAQALHAASDGLFDVSLGSGPRGWHCADGVLEKRAAAVQLDLGGIGKGCAVDAAVDTLKARGVAGGWVNAGGDLRAFGAAEVPIWLRDETTGGAHVFATLAEGAFATSHYAGDSRSTAVAPRRRNHADAPSHEDASNAPSHEDGSDAPWREDAAGAPSREIVEAPRRRDAAAAHVSVAAPQCLWADALTKIVALSGDAQHALLSHHAATAWRHA